MSELVQINLIWATVAVVALTITALIAAVAKYKYKELDKRGD